ncbi:agrin-like isoform X4 [Atheta coriaria]|uniref:agrin-like isoform X4 n=1 Tax=Dalotia coriaria TaxID=877792 RepID=UPI0031F36517
MCHKLISNRTFVTYALCLFLFLISNPVQSKQDFLEDIFGNVSNTRVIGNDKSYLRRRHAILYAPYCKYDTDIIDDDKLLAEEVRKADYVFSGRVSSEIRRADDNRTLLFSITVKRHFRHPGALEGRNVVRVEKILRKDEGVKCRQVVRYRYTAIFVGRKPEESDVHQLTDVQLTISPVPITLDNLDRINDATKDVAYKPKHLYVEERNDPCKDKQCGFGAHCVASPDGHNASCRCPENCRNYGDHPGSRSVCGSDGVNYKDQCELQRAACESKINVTIKFLGKCDPCLGIQCPEPEICQLDEHRNPVCRCGDVCPLEFTPVCASDGKTYANECSLRQEACRARKTLNIIYRGKCSSGANPCKSVQCLLGEECAIDKFGIARCECPLACEPVMRPVCAKDGRTYPSECELIRAGCLARVAVEIGHVGVCGGTSPCSDYECKYGATCVERLGKAFCECPAACSAEFEPVCGSDGVSYGNECKLLREACLRRKEIAVLYKGPCSECESKKCDFYASCESDGFLEGRCVCPQFCSDIKLRNGTVCGTDGVTYANECDLRISSCKTKQYVITAYNGNCDLCSGVECKYGAHCEAGVCVCPTDCEGSDDELVCASNMVTYPNECHMQKASCSPQINQTLSVAFYGDCRERFPVPGSALPTLSPTVASSSVIATSAIAEAESEFPAGSENLSGLVRSYAEREACRNIHCDFEATCELAADNFPRCTCRFDCGAVKTKPVCASDLRMYESLCAMKMEACHRQEELRIRPLDLCEGMEVKPCNGESPLLDELTGKELDCGNGPNRQDCPSDSYCHQTARFARCCYKDQSELTQKGCEDSWFGCCPDGRTAAQGVDHAGCPSTCGCNKLGSYSETCDPDTQQCRCRPGVGGEKCDRCEPGYWGLPKISSGHHGCIPCGCSTFGSVRDDCEQMTGRCVCKPGIQGQKCTVCAQHDRVLGPNGCVPADLSAPPPATCKELTCHFGAACIERGRFASCECNSECTEESNPQIVCGSDGQTYASACKLRQVACQFQKDIVVQAFGTCREDGFPGTDWPLRRYTPLQYTQSDDSNSPLSKSTRHLLMPDPRYYYERPGQLNKNGATFTVDARKTNGQPGKPFNSEYPYEDLYNTSDFRPTPATVRVVTALLGDLCSDNSDCLIMFSSCVRGACNCIPAYSESSDRKECIADVNPTEEYRACSSSPCLNEAKCVDLPSATFTCVCHPSFTGEFCETELEHQRYNIPAFDGHSYVRLKPLKAYHKLTLELEFKTYTNNGILVYNQQKEDGHGDFVSLAIVNGYVEFRYNLGDGLVVITSLEKVEMKKFHHVSAKRYHRDGMLQLDNGENVAGQSSGTLRALDLVEDTFVGFIPSNYSRVYENIGVDRGLQGCIRNFKIDRRTVELHEHRDEWVVKAEGVHECGANPCANSPCQNGGECRTVDVVSFRCDCNGSGYTGNLCENIADPCQSKHCMTGATCESINGKAICKCPAGQTQTGNACEHAVQTEISIPEFNGSSFLQFPKLEGVSKAFTLEIVFLSRVRNGLLLYNGQMKNGHGDFISLALVRGHVQFRYNLGSGIANITSREVVTLGSWHRVRMFRNGREGVLQLDNNTLVKGYSGAPLTELNLELPLYIGSVISTQEVHRLAGVTKGFRGAIREFLVNGSPLPISAKVVGCSFVPVNSSGCGFDIAQYDASPCSVETNPCLNNAVCIPNVKDYSCQCPENYEGVNCETRKSQTAIKFSGQTFLQFKNRGYKSSNVTSLEEDNDYDFQYDDDDDNDDEKEEDIDTFNENTNYDTNSNNLTGRKGERGNRYEIKLRTFVADGLILWRSKNMSLKNDYLSVAIINGYPEFSYNLGKQKTFWAIRSETKLNDGQWHTIHVWRRKRIGFLSVDNQTETKGISDSGAFTLNTNSKLWIGGAPSLPTGLPTAYYTGYEGCIQHVHVHAKPINLAKHNDPTILRFCNDNEI